MFKFPLLKSILFISIAALVILPAYVTWFVYPSFTKLLTLDSEDDAVRIATHLKQTLLVDVGELKKETLPQDFPSEAEVVRKDFGLTKIKVFSAQGEIIYSTDPREIGKVNREKYFREVVAQGNTYTKFVKKDTQSLEGQTVTADVVETYVPVMRRNTFAGAFEVYLDITGRKARLDNLITGSHTVLFTIAVCLSIAVVMILLKASKSIEDRKRAEGQIIRQSSELEKMNSELAALYEVSSAISRTIDMDRLLTAVMDSVTRLKIFNVEPKGGIFIVEGHRMKLASHRGHTKTFVDLHKDIEIEDCFCGPAAKSEEIIVAKRSEKDPRPTIPDPEMEPNGHICIPLKAINRLVGVLYLYLPPDLEIDEGKTKMLLSLGNQIGVAIENARLYEQTRLLALQDSLTGLANRRLMDIVLERSFAEAKRYGSPISAIMLDIDHFKKYNDAHGHMAGDRLLIDIAKLLLHEARDADLVVRYGGEEFLILLPETELTNANEVAERVRKTVKKEKGVTVSLGVSMYRQGMKKEDLISKVDEALYRAKKEGRNRVRINA